MSGNPAGFTVWLTGLSGSGKTTVAREIVHRLRHGTAEQRQRVILLDGDSLRRTLCHDLGFSRADREENARRLVLVAEALQARGRSVVVAAIAPFRVSRALARARLSPFVEVWTRCPLPVLCQRDPKGLYRRALAGEIAHFTGVSDPYEEPETPDLVLETAHETVAESVGRLWDLLHRRGLLAPRAPHLPPRKPEESTCP